MKQKTKTKLETDIFRVIINYNPRREPEGQLREIMRLIKENQNDKKEKTKS